MNMRQNKKKKLNNFTIKLLLQVKMKFGNILMNKLIYRNIHNKLNNNHPILMQTYIIHGDDFIIIISTIYSFDDISILSSGFTILFLTYLYSSNFKIIHLNLSIFK